MRQIVLIEDNPADVELVREALEEHKVSCEVLVLSDGERATRFLDEVDAGRRTCPALFILDLNLPRKPGTEVLQRMRGTGSCPLVPVVVLTSSDNRKDRDAVAEFRPSWYIRKPSVLEDFLELGKVFKGLLYPHE